MLMLDSRTNPTIHAAAFAANEAEAKRLCEETQKLWDAGRGFIPSGSLDQLFGFEPRRSDRQEELDAAVGHLETKLAMVAIQKTISQMTREECVTLVRALNCIDMGARVKALGQELQAADISHIWNDQHPSEAQIILNEGIAFEI